MTGPLVHRGDQPFARGVEETQRSARPADLVERVDVDVPMIANRDFSPREEASGVGVRPQARDARSAFAGRTGVVDERGDVARFVRAERDLGFCAVAGERHARSHELARALAFDRPGPRTAKQWDLPFVGVLHLDALKRARDRLGNLLF